MEDTLSIASLMDSATSKIQQLQKAFAELESHRAVTLNLKWKELEDHFHGLEKSLKRRFHELDDQEKDYGTKTMEHQERLEKREAAVVAKEEVLLEKLQKRRDAAVFAIADVNAQEKHQKLSSHEGTSVTGHSLCEEPNVVEKPLNSSAAEIDSEDVKDSSVDGNFGVKSYPQLVKLCEEMDSNGLHKFISDNRKNLAAIREEIPFALKAAVNPAHLVLNSLEDFYCGEVVNLEGKKDSHLLGLRRTCIMLMECLSIYLKNLDLVSVSDVISEDVKERAKGISEEWKPKLDALDVDASNGNSLEAHAFLQLLDTYKISSDFGEEELSRLIPMVSRRRQTADLCHSLGLAKKMTGVIEVLISSSRQIDAVHLASAFELTEQFPLVPLLKSYLKEAKKISSPTKPGNTFPIAQNEVNERELAAFKAVIKCIEEHKLEDQYAVDPLQKRVIQMEKAKAEKKRVTEAARPQPKRPRANSVGYGPPPRAANAAPDKTMYPRMTDNRYQQYVYDRPLYAYPGPPTENHCPSFIGSASYNHLAAHANYFGNGYQYQAAYLH